MTCLLYVPTGVQAGCHQQPRVGAHAGKEAISGLSDRLTASGSGNILFTCIIMMAGGCLRAREALPQR